jgi:kynureninase
VEVVRIAAQPAATVGDRLAAVVDDRTAAVLTSTIFFRSAHIAGSLPAAAEACRRFGAALVLDVYHQLNVVPFSVRELGLEDVFAVGGGNKYCQLGEGNAFLRFPADCELRPLVTGWFAEFEALSGPEGEPVAYSEGPWRFAGATYDPTSNYRAAAVFDFFHEMELDPERLRSLSQNQVGLLARGFDALDLPAEVIDRDRTVELPGVGGFLALRSPHAGALCRHLAAAGVTTDFRDDVLRLGPAPYLSRRQLEDAVEALGAVVGSLAPVG